MEYEITHTIEKNKMVAKNLTYNTIAEFGIVTPQTKKVFNMLNENGEEVSPNWFDTYQINEDGSIIFGITRSKGEQESLKKYVSYRLYTDLIEKYKFIYGAISPEGKLIIEPLLDFLEYSNESTLMGTYKQKKGYFSSLDGTQITPICFVDAYYYHDGLARVRYYEKYGYIDHRLMRNPSNRDQYQIPADFTEATDFKNGKALVSTKTESFTIDQSGHKTEIKKLSLKRNWYYDSKW